MSTTPEPMTEERLADIERRCNNGYIGFGWRTAMGDVGTLLAEVRRAKLAGADAVCKLLEAKGLLLERARQAEELSRKLETMTRAVQKDDELIADLKAEVERLKVELAQEKHGVDFLNLQVRELVELLVKRRAMEPRHSEESHECDECTVLAEMGRSRDGFVVKRVDTSALDLQRARRAVVEAAKEWRAADEAEAQDAVLDALEKVENAVDALEKLEGGGESAKDASDQPRAK